MLLQNLKESRRLMKGFDNLTLKNIKNEEMIKNSIGFGQKRKFEEINGSDYRFIYKYNEGVTNSVRKKLNINYFFK